MNKRAKSILAYSLLAVIILSGFTYMVNITPALYVWEAGNKTAAQISSEVQALINNTKQTA